MKQARKYLEVVKDVDTTSSYDHMYVVTEKDAVVAARIAYNEAIDEVLSKIDAYLEKESIPQQAAVSYLLGLGRDIKKLRK